MTSNAGAVNNPKRKLDDYASDDLVPPPSAVRMRKDQFTLTSFTDDSRPRHHSPSSSSTPSSSSSSSMTPSSSSLASSSGRLQFFVRLLSGGNTLVLQTESTDSVKSVHEKIQFITGIPIIEQRLIYRGKQLQWEQTLVECEVQNDAGLQLVGRMRSTGHPQAWQLINDLVSQIFDLCKGQNPRPSSRIKTRLTEFLTMTPRNDAEQAAEHLQIFLSSCAPAALVMLYMSQAKVNKDTADESIRQFVNSSKTVLPKPIYMQCAPIVLEFCKLLSGAAGVDDSLYGLCRSSLGGIVESVGISRWESNGKDVIALVDIFPFVRELGVKLSRALDPSMESLNAFMGPSLNDVRDFTAFMRPVRNVIGDHVAICSPIAFPLQEECGTSEGGSKRYGMPYYREQIKCLHDIYFDLLEKLELCLKKMEEHFVGKEKGEGEPFALGWSQYLAILKEINGISKLFKGSEDEFWKKIIQRRVSLCFLIVKFAKRSEDHRWILEHKEVTNFEARRHLAMMMLPEVKDEYEELHEMLIDRSQLLSESFEYIAHADPESLRGGLFMEFKNEEATGPGVLREWFFLVCQAIFNPQNALFVACPNDRRRFFPNPTSKVDPLHLEYFSFSGRVIALALMHKIQVGVVFDRVFFLQLSGKNISLDDIRDADPYLYSSCKQILEMDPEMVDQDTLALTFVREVEELGSRKVVELCPNGRSTMVTSKNREQYVELLIQHRFVTSIAEQVAHFAQGFADIITTLRLQKSFFQSLDLEDLDWMLHGSETAVSVEDWKAHTDYNGYKESDPQISWFWKIVGCMSAEQRKVLLFFWTSIKYLPVEGFGGLASRLYIYKTRESYDRLPSSHTCFYRLCFPPYPSMDVMQDRLRIITQEHVGCSFGTW
ncbi:E3 ubiquitin-protein ligase UPL5 isoform X1 [Nicotiana tabacum]|uniref:E3 ubiquitin-protein ligase UPL5 isoform X1 n=2 Tax=Nicotiana tabacum TaxID=4097 RepID=A0AC58SFW6_TOBAC|nr:E3 ubiquitin-protein ligase UPL5 isoform X1 [Nicotiana tomentosiformis]XP_016453329.1 PREDICTED: E3 ubiquitin-protein ligase UPL5-like isoform X1 [Nicotiana tabacum]